MATTLETTPTPTFTRTDRAGFVPGVTHLALDVVDRGQSTVIAVLQDARSELRTFADHGIEFAEKGTASLFRFARSLVKRVDDAAAETLSSTERLLGNAVKSARETAKSATDTANTAISGITAQA
jgi:predicted phage tail protein